MDMMLFKVFLLFLSAVSVMAYWPYPDPGPDIPPAQQFCQQRPVQQCCPGRDDYCTVPILDTVCYCDVFCNRTISDCCPDFWGHCMGIAPPPGALTPPPPIVDVINNCVHMGETHQLGSMMTSNCNNCTCVSVPGLKKRWNWDCTQHICVIRPDFIKFVNQDNKGWQAGNYSFLWGMTLDDGVVYRLGTFRPEEPVRDMTSLRVHINEILPAEFDAREEWPGLVHGVYDQGNCGSSWAFSTTSVAADRLSIHSNGYLKEMLSPQHLLSCNHDPNQKGCEGGHLDRAWWYMRNKGVVSYDCYPYTSGASNYQGQCLIPSVSAKARPTCVNRQSNSRVFQASPPYRIAPNEREIMKEIMENGPVQATMEVKEDFFMYKEGVYRYSMPAEYMFPNHRKTGFHSVRIIGWGTEYLQGRQVKYWLCVNSWGEHWGERGLFRIVRGEDECKIESFVVGVWGKVDGRQIVNRGNNRRSSSGRRRSYRRPLLADQAQGDLPQGDQPQGDQPQADQLVGDLMQADQPAQDQSLVDNLFKKNPDQSSVDNLSKKKHKRRKNRRHHKKHKKGHQQHKE